MTELTAFLAILIGTGAVSYGATFAFIRLARRWGITVAPRPDRWHARPTPLLGGAAITLAVLAGFAVFLAPTQTSAILVIAAALAFALGLLDDFRHIAPTTKLVGQVLVASLLYFGGIRIEVIAFAPVAYLATVFWVVGLMNAINLLDNMDGLAAGIIAIAASVVGISALAEAHPVSAVAAVITGGAVGFLPHNFSPARVFMGDAGSQLLGLLIAALAILYTTTGAADLGLAILGPLAVLAVPILDTALVTATRRISGRPIAQGGRDHSSHRLAALGLSDRSAVLVLYAVAATLAVAGLLAEQISALILPFLVVSTIALILFGSFLGGIDVYGDRDRRGDSAVIRALKIYGRFGAEVGMDVALVTTAYYLAYVVRFEAIPPQDWTYLFVESLPIVVGIQLAALVVSGVYRTLWRYLSVPDAVVIVRAVAIGTAMAALAVVAVYRFEGYSRAVFVLDGLLVAGLILGSRSFFAWLWHWSTGRPTSGERRVLIVGADDAGALALRVLARTSRRTHRAVGFLDDDPGKRYRRVAGIPVVGTTADLPKVVGRLHPDLVLFAMEDPATTEALRLVCDELGVSWRDFTVEV